MGLITVFDDVFLSLYLKKLNDFTRENSNDT